jgi:hypothetical protein
MKQEDFEKRGFLEMLHDASRGLYNESTKGSKKHFTHLFTLNGDMIKSLKHISKDTKILVCSEGKIFKGVINIQKLVNFGTYKLLKSRDV